MPVYDVEPIVLSDTATTSFPAPTRPFESGTLPILFPSHFHEGDDDDDVGEGDREGFDNVVHPYPQENWFENLRDASVLYISADPGLFSLPAQLRRSPPHLSQWC